MAPYAGIQGTDGRPLNAHVTITDPTPLPAFLRLPRELRDIIYEQYVYEDGGYVYNPETDKLAHADGSPILLSLALVCRQTRAELEGLPLRLNTIRFTSTFLVASRDKVATHDAIVCSILWQKRALLSRLIPHLLTAEMTKTIATAYPQFSPILDGWKANSHTEVMVLRNPSVSCGEAPSVWHDYIHYIFDQMSRHPEFVCRCQQEEDRMSVLPSWQSFDGCRASELSRLHPNPWRIMEDSKLKEIAPIAQVDLSPPNYYPQTKYTHSAAAQALRFLNSLPHETRQSVRNVVLEETCESVSYPASHGRGFIPLCQENPQLRVRRLASLSKSVFAVSSVSRQNYAQASANQLESTSMHSDQLASKDITRAVGEWIMEASVLPALGMPEGSYTLVLDGEPISDYTSKVFQIVQRDVAWQAALDASYTRGSLPTPSWLDRRLRPAYLYEGLPDAIRKLSKEHLLIQCNFDAGLTHDVESLLQDNRGWSPSQWDRNWETHTPSTFQTKSPLPPWHELRWLYVLSGGR